MATSLEFSQPIDLELPLNTDELLSSGFEEMNGTHATASSSPAAGRTLSFVYVAVGIALGIGIGLAVGVLTMPIHRAASSGSSIGTGATAVENGLQTGAGSGAKGQMHPAAVVNPRATTPQPASSGAQPAANRKASHTSLPLKRIAKPAIVPAPAQQASAQLADSSSFHIEGIFKVVDYDASAETLQANDGKTFRIGAKTAVLSDASTLEEEVGSSVSYRCGQDGSCTLNRLGFSVNARLVSRVRSI